MQSEEQETCVVCMDALDANVHTMEQCGHKFHSACIIEWMRRGHMSCPTCRDDLREQSSSIPPMILYTRAKYIRRTFARRVGVPSDLKRLITNLRETEALEQEHKRELKEFESRHSVVLKEVAKQRVKRWKLHRRKQDLIRLLGMYQAPGLNLPPLQIVNTTW